MKISAKTDVGKARKNNQDFYSYGELPDGMWAVVCDGMGGHAGGQEASKIAVEKISSCIKSNFRGSMNTYSVKNMLESAIIGAGIAICDKAQKNAQLYGMGTTAVVAVCLGSNAVIAHVGDSRCYLFDGEKIKQITKDHSLVQQMVDAGLITAEEAQNHPRKNIITRALGMDDDNLEVEFNELEIKNNDVLLLCTDGLTNRVTEEELAECLKGDDVHNFAERLISLANEKDGTDNITAVAIKK